MNLSDLDFILVVLAFAAILFGIALYQDIAIHRKRRKEREDLARRRSFPDLWDLDDK